MDHRWGERFSFDLTVKVAARQHAVRPGRLTDLSVSGAKIQISADLRPLTRIQVAIALPSRLSQPTPVVSGYVTRRFADGVGIEWSEFAPDAVRELLKAARAHRNELLARQRPDLDASEDDIVALKTISL
jgi:hypothetical protein